MGAGMSGALEAAKRVIIGSIMSDMPTEEFISGFCHIENKDVEGTPVIKFDMWDSQKAALRDIMENRLVIALKARQIGMTWLVLCFAAHMLLKNEGWTAIFLSQRLDLAWALIDRMDLIYRHMPKWLIVTDEERKAIKKKGGRMPPFWFTKSRTTLDVVRTAGGERSKVRSEAATLGSGRSLTADFVFFDEWAYHVFGREPFTAIYPTLVRPGASGRFVGLSTNQRGTYFEDVWKNNKTFKKIFLNAFADPRRDAKWLAAQESALGEKVQQEYPMTEEEALRAGTNVAFPEWSQSAHVCEPFPIPQHWRRFGAVDHGIQHPFAWYKLAVSETGTVYVYYELSRFVDEPEILYSDQARQFAADLRHLDSAGREYAEHLDFMVAGLDMWQERRGAEKTVLDLYEAGGLSLNWVPCKADRALRKATLHEYLRTFEDESKGGLSARLQVFSTCRCLIATLPLLVRDDNDQEKVKGMAEIDNCYDALGYGLMQHHAPRSAEKRQNPNLGEVGRIREMYFGSKHKKKGTRKNAWRRPGISG